MYGKTETREAVLLPRPEASSRSTVLPQANSVGNFFQVHGRTQACETVLLRIQREKCYPLGNNWIEEILSSPTKTVHLLLFNLGDGYS